MRNKMGAGWQKCYCRDAGLLRRERDLLILTGGMRDIVKTKGGLWNEKQKITRHDRYAENYNSDKGGIRINILNGTGWSDCAKNNG